jgi:hypothetical protein
MLALSSVGVLLVLLALGALAMISYRNGRRRDSDDRGGGTDSQSSPN